MGAPFRSKKFLALAAVGISLALLLPAQAQFWDWGNRPQRQQRYNDQYRYQDQYRDQYRQQHNDWGGWFSPGRDRQQQEQR